jgi:hypothetical protein
MPERAQAEQSDRVLVEAETAEAGAEACKRGRGYAAAQRLGAPQLIPDTGYRIQDTRCTILELLHRRQPFPAEWCLMRRRRFGRRRKAAGVRLPRARARDVIRFSRSKED